jgi:hypothetical protein
MADDSHHGRFHLKLENPAAFALIVDWLYKNKDPSGNPEKETMKPADPEDPAKPAKLAGRKFKAGFRKLIRPLNSRAIAENDAYADVRKRGKWGQFSESECITAIDFSLLAKKLSMPMALPHALRYFIANAAPELTLDEVEYIYSNTVSPDALRIFTARWVIECQRRQRRRPWACPGPEGMSQEGKSAHEGITRWGRYDPRKVPVEHWFAMCARQNVCAHSVAGLAPPYRRVDSTLFVSYDTPKGVRLYRSRRAKRIMMSVGWVILFLIVALFAMYFALI